MTKQTDPVARARSDVNRRGLMLVLSSPSGAGKSTIARNLLSDDPDISLSVSVTTRARRGSEIDGKDYIVWDKNVYAMPDSFDPEVPLDETKLDLVGTIRESDGKVEWLVDPTQK